MKLKLNQNKIKTIKPNKKKKKISKQEKFKILILIKYILINN